MNNGNNLLSRRLSFHFTLSRSTSCILELGSYDVLKSYNNIVLYIQVIYGTSPMSDDSCACATPKYVDTPLILN